ncbi:MAG: DUF2891 domain-containing protein [Frankiaceae bacterium]
METAATPALAPERADALARLALTNVRTEYPNSSGHVMSGPGEDLRPRVMHPAFYGSFDWHSCVHMHWLLVRLLRLFPGLAVAGEARKALDDHFAPGAIAVEAAYLESRPTFQRPYGWGWALRLIEELAGWAGDPASDPASDSDGDPRRWAAALQPLADVVTTRFLDWLPRATYPIRHGVHSNSAFGLVLAHGHAVSCGRAELADAIEQAALRWFAGDADYPAGWEPSGEDFLSPALVEAELMRRVLGPERFAGWLDAFLPGLADGVPAALLAPAVVSDRSDYRIVHLDGLNLSRAWCWRSLAGALPPDDPRHERAVAAAAAHLDAALPHVASGEYGGDHWLASFALLALSG